MFRIDGENKQNKPASISVNPKPSHSLHPLEKEFTKYKWKNFIQKMKKYKTSYKLNLKDWIEKYREDESDGTISK